MSVLLFDIDGTLTPGPDLNHMSAIIAALDEIFDVQVTLDEFQQREFHGSTTPGMAAAVLRGRGRERDFDDQGSAWARAMHKHFRTATNEHPKPFADAPRAVESARAAGHETALLTGNYKAVARLKLSAVGMWDLFDEQLGGFADDGNDRDDVAIAAKDRIVTRFGPRIEVFVIGDTPRDITCARAISAYALAVTTGDFGAADLAGADKVFATIGAAVRHVCQSNHESRPQIGRAKTA